MNIINPNDFQKKKYHNGKMIMSINNFKIVVKKETADRLGAELYSSDGKSFYCFELGTDDKGQLHIKASKQENLTALIFRLNADRAECGNSGLCNHLKKLHPTNSEKATVNFLISEAKNEEGWYPVITNYK